MPKIDRFSVFFRISTSLNLFTAADYHRFRSTPFDHSVTGISVFPGAGAAFADIKDYANTVDIQYMDGKGNMITTSARKRSVTANYMNGPVALAYLPRNFSAYTININGGAIVVAADVDAILQWTAATTIKIADNKKIARVLIERIDDLNKLNVDLSVASH